MKKQTTMKDILTKAVNDMNSAAQEGPAEQDDQGSCGCDGCMARAERDDRFVNELEAVSSDEEAVAVISMMLMALAKDVGLPRLSAAAHAIWVKS